MKNTEDLSPKKKGLVFDFDGTLANSLTAPFGAFHYALKQVSASVKSDDDIRRYFGTGADKIFAELLIHSEHSTEKAKEKATQKAIEAFQHYLHYQEINASFCTWHFGIESLLDKISKAKTPTAIVTGRHSEDLKRVSKTLKLNDYFEFQICDDHLKFSKPNPDGINLAALKLGLKPSQIMYVGDSLVDLMAARAAGAVGVAALWDLNVDTESLKSHAHFCAHTADEVWKTFTEWHPQS